MITTASFKIRFPEFAATDDDRIQLFIDDATIVLNEVYWGTKYNMGLSYYSAHLLALADKTEAGKKGTVLPVAGRAVDGTSVSYATGNIGTGGKSGNAWENSTQYGQRYLALRNNLGVPASVI